MCSCWIKVLIYFKKVYILTKSLTLNSSESVTQIVSIEYMEKYNIE